MKNIKWTLVLVVMIVLGGVITTHPEFAALSALERTGIMVLWITLFVIGGLWLKSPAPKP